MRVTVTTDSNERGFLVRSEERALIMGFRSGLDRRPAISMTGHRAWLPIPGLLGDTGPIELDARSIADEIAVELAIIYGSCAARFGDSFWSMLLPPSDSVVYPAARLVAEECGTAVGHRTARRGLGLDTQPFFSLAPDTPVLDADVHLADPSSLRRNRLRLTA